MNKRNLIIGIIILIALVGGVVLWQQKNNQENTKQQTKKEVVEKTQEQKTTEKQETTKEQSNNQNQVIEGELKLEEKIDTSDWKTYRNEELGFEVKYPKGWKVGKFKSPTKFDAPTPIDCNKTPEKCPYELILFSAENQDDYSHIRAFSVRSIKDGNFNCDEKGALSFDRGSEFASGCHLTYTLKIGKRCIVVSASDKLARCDEKNIDMLFKKIISTIKGL